MKGLMKFVCGALMVAALWACGHSDTFVLQGRLADGASMNLRIIYYCDGKAFPAVTAATDGVWTFEGTSPDDALIEVYDNDYNLLCRLVARNGDDIDVKLDKNDYTTFTAEGNELTERWAEFTRSHAGASGADRNAAIAGYVAEHSDDPLSALLIATEYDINAGNAGAADSLLNAVATESRLSGITAGYAAMLGRINSATSHAPVAAIPYWEHGGHVRTYNVLHNSLTLIAISDRSHDRDSVVQLMRRLEKYEAKKRLALADFSVDGDTIDWSRYTRNDSATWLQGWVAGSISGSAIRRLGIPALPFFVLADSTGTQLWRGSTASQAEAAVVERLTD